MGMLGSNSESSSSAEVDVLNLCTTKVRNIEDLVNGEELLNKRQCLDLSLKISKTTLNIREHLLHCGTPIVLFRPVLEDLYRYLEKARLIVCQCGAKNWCAAAVFQIQNENAFREILLDVGLCYNAIYELAKSEGGNVHAEDLRETSVFLPAIDSEVQKDLQDVQERLKNVSIETSEVTVLRVFRTRIKVQKPFLAKHLLLKLNHISKQPESSASVTRSAIPVFWSRDSEPLGTWGGEKFLGSGSGGSVCRTKWLGVRCARKEFHGQESEGTFLKEASLMAHLKHPCIVDFICCGNGQERGHRFIAMELLERNLLDLIQDQNHKHFPIHVAVDIIVQIARGTCYLHDRGVAHRDLKPQNVVVNRLSLPHLEDQFCVKLVDFGMSKSKVGVSKPNTISIRGVGTTRYRAPEVHPKANPNGKGKVIWFKADIYSFAMTCAHILTLNTPFGDKERQGEFYAALMRNERPKLPVDCPKELVALLSDCWDTNPHSRPSFVEVCTRLEWFRHKFLRGFSALHEGLQEDTIDFNRAFDFIKTKLEEQSSIRSPLVANTDDEVEDENIKNDTVATIPCTCGHVLELLPLVEKEAVSKQVARAYVELGSTSSGTSLNSASLWRLRSSVGPQLPYISLPQSETVLWPVCNVCSNEVYGSVYHCETCGFVGHPDCVEIKDMVKVRFHDDRLHLLVHKCYEENEDAICRFCEKPLEGSEWVYRCEQCDFDVHAFCTKYSKVIKFSRHRHPLILIECLPHKSLFCTCCSGEIQRYYYTCIQKWCEYTMHPFCAIRPLEPLCIFCSSHRLYIIDKCTRFHCGSCGELGFSWSYYCDDCDVNIHLDCIDDMEVHEDDWNGVYENFILQNVIIDNHAKMDMILELLDKLFVNDTSEASSLSRPTVKSVQPSIQRVTLEESPDLDALDDVDLRKKIIVENTRRKAKKMVTKKAKQRLKGESVEKLENLEKIVLDLQNSTNLSQNDAKVLTSILKKLKKRQEIARKEAIQVLSKMRQGPRIAVFSKFNDVTGSTEMLASLKEGMVNVSVMLLCEEPGHEHIVYHHAFSGSGRKLSRVLGQEWEKIQPLLDSGLEVVTRAMDALEPQPTELDFVTLPTISKYYTIWNLRAIDIGKHSKQSKNPVEVKENVKVLQKAKDIAARWLLCRLEAMGVNIFQSFGLWRVRYIGTEDINSPLYTRESVAWLCTEHRKSGIEAGMLESFPLQTYHNVEYDDQQQVIGIHCH